MTDHNFLSEIDADLEREKMEALWKRYGGWIIVLALLIVAATGAYTAWHSWRADKDQQASAGLMAAIEASEANPSKEIETLEAFAKNDSGTTQAVFAQLHAASFAAEQGDKDKALQIYKNVANDSGADKAFRQLASLMAVRTQLDSGDPVALDKELQPLMAEGAPWRFTAMEYDGYLAFRSGDKAKAQKVFTDLSQNAAVPHSIGERAADMLRYVSE